MEHEHTPQNDLWKKIEKSQRRGRIMGGLLVIAAGSLFLAKELGAEIPTWIFSWKVLLIGIGIVLAIKHKFMHPGWIILVGIGGVFLLNDFYPDMQIKPFLWPALLILIGLFILFKPRHKHNHHAQLWRKKWEEKQKQRQTCDRYRDWEQEDFDEDFIESTNVMGGVKKNFLSKKFKGGEIVNVFGGAHINLTQSDFEGTATLSVTQVFGGTKLIVPANWEIKSTNVTICGGIEDKRPTQPVPTNGEAVKVLQLIGTTVFGGIEIKSHD
jgi:predicted membrane protein